MIAVLPDLTDCPDCPNWQNGQCWKPEVPLLFSDDDYGWVSRGHRSQVAEELQSGCNQPAASSFVRPIAQLHLVGSQTLVWSILNEKPVVHLLGFAHLGGLYPYLTQSPETKNPNPRV